MERTNCRSALVAVWATAIMLGGIVYAQQEAPSSSGHAIAGPVTPTHGERSRPIRDALRGWITDRNHQATNSPTSNLDSAPPEQVVSQPPQSEAPFLKDLAAWLSVPIPENATPGDISSAIQQALSKTLQYSGEVFSDTAFDECRAAIPTTKDTKTFETYHEFIKKVEGKKVIVIDTKPE